MIHSNNGRVIPVALRLFFATFLGAYIAGFTYDLYVLATRSFQYFGSWGVFFAMSVPSGVVALVYACYAVVPLAIAFSVLKINLRIAIPVLVLAGVATSVTLDLLYFKQQDPHFSRYLVSVLPGFTGGLAFAFVRYFRNENAGT